MRKWFENSNQVFCLNRDKAYSCAYFIINMCSESGGWHDMHVPNMASKRMKIHSAMHCPPQQINERELCIWTHWMRYKFEKLMSNDWNSIRPHRSPSIPIGRLSR